MNDRRPDPPAVAGELLRAHFGFDEFRSGQLEVIEALLAGGSALAVFPTGGGKSLCYQLPALALDGVTLVVSPLIALMKDQIDFLQGRGVAAARLDSTLTAEDSHSVGDALREGSLKLLYVAPERFNNERFLSQLRRARIALFAIDEAHCISEWGHNFRPDYLKLARIRSDLGVPRVLALTATATPAVVRDICAAFDIPAENAVITGFYRKNLELRTTPVTAGERDGLLLARLRERTPGPTIVYVTLQKTAERVADSLVRAGLPARAYHAGMETDARTDVQDGWMASDRGIVVATIAFGMGIDKAGVRYVYHYNLPKSLESYSQEIGRAGRDGAPSVVELFACPADVPALDNFAYGDTPTDSSIRALLTELFGGPADLELNLYELSARHDMRLLVLRTLLTYMELLGVLHQSTPFYAGYEIRPLIPVHEIVAKFHGEPAELVRDLFAHAKQGRIWYGLNPDEAAKSMGKERRRVVRAIEYLGEHGWAEIRSGDLRHRYTRPQPGGNAEDPEALVAEMSARFQAREDREIARVRQVLELVTHEGCQTGALAAYFGEVRPDPCGHCSFCLSNSPQRLPPTAPYPPPPDGLDTGQFRALRSSHPEALDDARQAARFLCGLGSPALTRTKLSRHPLFGVWESRGFREVLDWCQG